MFCSWYMEGVETIFSQPTRTMEESTRTVLSVALDNRELTSFVSKYYGHQYNCTTIQCSLYVLTLIQLPSHAGCTKV